MQKTGQELFEDFVREQDARVARADPGSFAGDAGLSAEDIELGEIDGNIVASIGHEWPDEYAEDKRADMIPRLVSHPDGSKLSRLDHYVLALVASSARFGTARALVKEAQAIIREVDNAR